MFQFDSRRYNYYLIFILSAVVLSLGVLNSSYIFGDDQCLDQNLNIEHVNLKFKDKVVGSVAVCGITKSEGLKGFEWGQAIEDINERYGHLMKLGWTFNSPLKIEIDMEHEYHFSLPTQSTPLIVGKSLFWARTQMSWLLVYSIALERTKSTLLSGMITDYVFAANDLLQLKDPRTFSSIQWPQYDFMNSLLSEREYCQSPWKFANEYAHCIESDLIAAQSLRVYWMSFWQLIFNSINKGERDYLASVVTPEALNDVSGLEATLLKPSETVAGSWSKFLELLDQFSKYLKTDDPLGMPIVKKIEAARDVLDRLNVKDGKARIDYLLSLENDQFLKVLLMFGEEKEASMLAPSILLEQQGHTYRLRNNREIPSSWFKESLYRNHVIFSCSPSYAKDVVNTYNQLGHIFSEDSQFWYKECGDLSRSLKEIWPLEPGWQNLAKQKGLINQISE